MARISRCVINNDQTSDELPEWLSEGMLAIDFLARRKTLDDVSKRFRVQRQGGYAGIDAFLFLVMLLCSRLRFSIKDFGDRIRRHTKRLAAIGGRRRLPTPSSVSRLLSAVTHEHVRPFAAWLLLSACEPEKLLRHPLATSRDTQGEPWHLFDWDPTVTALRHRALPQGPDLPAPARRSEEMASPGHMGRKRGEVRFSRVTVQHSGTGQWVYAALTDGPGDCAAVLPPALEAIAETCQMAGATMDRAIIRSDGGAGSVGWITECERSGARYLTRLARYLLLEQPEVRRHLNEGVWHEVPSSGSGPSRAAAEIGWVTLNPGKESRAANGDALLPIRTRVIVSRFAADKKAGAGIVIDGWQYELFSTNLSAQAWPAAEIVQLYYGRCAQENRFGQEDRELNLDRIFSYNLPGQELAVVIGLFLWNIRTVRGFDQLTPPAVSPQPQPRVEVSVDVPPLPLPQETVGEDQPMSGVVGAPSVEPPAANVSDAHLPTTTVAGLCSKPGQEYLAAMNQLDWKAIVERLPSGWQRTADGLGLLCSNETCLQVSRVRPSQGRQSARIIFRASAPACRACPRRDDCGDGKPDFTKEVARSISEPLAETLIALHATERKRRRRARCEDTPAPPPTNHGMRAHATSYAVELSHGGLPGPCGIDGPFLIVSMLRQAVMVACDHMRVKVSLLVPPTPQPSHPSIAPTSAKRQHRRQTWVERERWNALPDGARVLITISKDKDTLCGYCTDLGTLDKAA